MKDFSIETSTYPVLRSEELHTRFFKNVKCFILSMYSGLISYLFEL